MNEYSGGDKQFQEDLAVIKGASLRAPTTSAGLWKINGGSIEVFGNSGYVMEIGSPSDSLYEALLDVPNPSDRETIENASLVQAAAKRLVPFLMNDILVKIDEIERLDQDNATLTEAYHAAMTRVNELHEEARSK